MWAHPHATWTALLRQQEPLLSEHPLQRVRAHPKVVQRQDHPSIRRCEHLPVERMQPARRRSIQLLAPRPLHQPQVSPLRRSMRAARTPKGAQPINSAALWQAAGPVQRNRPDRSHRYQVTIDRRRRATRRANRLERQSTGSRPTSLRTFARLSSPKSFVRWSRRFGSAAPRANPPARASDSTRPNWDSSWSMYGWTKASFASA